MGMRGEIRGVVHMRTVRAVILPDHFKLASYGNGILLAGKWWLDSEVEESGEGGGGGEGNIASH